MGVANNPYGGKRRDAVQYVAGWYTRKQHPVQSTWGIRMLVRSTPDEKGVEGVKREIRRGGLQSAARWWRTSQAAPGGPDLPLSNLYGSLINIFFSSNFDRTLPLGQQGQGWGLRFENTLLLQEEPSRESPRA